MSKHPVGTLVREDHPDDPRWPGSSVWLRIARWHPGLVVAGVRRGGTRFGWLCVQSAAPGNVLCEVNDGDADGDGFEDLPAIAIVPGSEAERQRSLVGQTCTCTHGFGRHRLLVPRGGSHCEDCDGCTGFVAAQLEPNGATA